MLKKNRELIFSFTIFLMLLFSLFISTFSGTVEISPKEILSGKIFDDEVKKTILFELRIPRIIIAFLVGASLSISGAILQAFFGNPLAEPYIIGVSSGSSFGAVLSTFIGINLSLLGMSSQAFFSFFFGLVTVLAVYSISYFRGEPKPVTLLLIGIIIGSITSSLTSIILIFKQENLQSFIFWMLGSFSGSDWKKVFNFFPYFVFFFSLSVFFSKDLNLLVMGDEMAKSTGLNVKFLRRISLIIATFLTSFSVSIAGIIGFVGLIIPHAVRVILGSDHRKVLPYSCFLGGVYLIYADLIARTIYPPSEIPVGVITSLIGAPIFLYLLKSSSKH
ncbi:MAG: iron ABC transporter permease [Acidobacteriota bacterium]